MGPWNADQINQARRVPFSKVLNFLGVYYKRDLDYEPLDPNRKSLRIQANYRGRDFRFIFTNEKWINEIAPIEHPERAGGGAIDLVMHITGQGFVQAVNICLEASEEQGAR